MRAAFAFVTLTSAYLTQGAEWSAAPSFGWSADYNSNRTMRDDGDPGEGAFLQMDMLLKRATPNSSLSLRPHVSFNRYSNDSLGNSDNESVVAAGLWRTTRSAYSAQVGYTQQNTLDTAFIDADLIGLDTRRRTKSAGLSWVHDQTRDRHELSVDFNYADVDYQGNEGYRLSGYRYPSVSITQSIGWSPRSAVSFTAYGARLTTDSDVRSDSYGAQVGFSYQLTPRIGASFSGGYSRQKIQQPFFFGLIILETVDSGYTGQFALTRRDTRGEWRLSAGRSVTPSGFGALVMRTEAGLDFTRHFAPRWSATLSLKHYGNKDIGDISAGEVHAAQRFAAGLGWQATRSWSLNATAILNRLERTANAADARGWSTVLAANWTPQPRYVSR